MKNDEIPIIIPLAEDPANQYIELKFTLRSIQTYYKGLGRIIILGPERPKWLHNVEFYYTKDESFSKDRNMITKIIHGIEVLRDTGYFGKFTKFSDDTMLLGPYNALDEKPKYFCPMADSLKRFPKSGNWHYTQWHERFVNTIDLLTQFGIKNPLNFETHTPQPYFMNSFIEIMALHNSKDVVINSFYLNQIDDNEFESITAGPDCENRLCCITIPGYTTEEIEAATINCKFLETDNMAFEAGDLEKYLSKRFKKSIFET